MNSDDVNLVVKHTFLEFTETPRARGMRSVETSLSDTDLLASAGLIVTTGAPSTPLSAPTTISEEDAQNGNSVAVLNCSSGDGATQEWPATPELNADEANHQMHQELACQMDEYNMSDWFLPAGAGYEDMSLQPMSPHYDCYTVCSPYMTPMMEPMMGTPVAYYNESDCMYIPELGMPCAAVTPSVGFCYLDHSAPCDPSDTVDAQFDESTASGGEDTSAVETLSEESLCSPNDLRTTLMLRNAPQYLSRSELLRMLDAEGLNGKYDFIYLPVNFLSEFGLGYAFINGTTPDNAREIRRAFDGKVFSDRNPTVKCSVTWSSPHQGLAAHIERYQNSPVMHKDVPDEWKPLLFSKGLPISFPEPTKQCKAPKVRGKKTDNRPENTHANSKKAMVWTPVSSKSKKGSSRKA